MHTFPHWVPQDAIQYINHIEIGVPIRELARRAGCHPSTISRTIQKYEARRLDPLIDHALARLRFSQNSKAKGALNDNHITSPKRHPISSEELTIKAPQILRQLCKPGLSLMLAIDMKHGLILKDDASSGSNGLKVDRKIAEAMALKGWIDCMTPGRVLRYKITQAGRTTLRTHLNAHQSSAQMVSQEITDFLPSNSKELVKIGGMNDPVRNNVEPPLVILARHKDKDGAPFLSNELVMAAERFREDFELAELEADNTIDWAKIILDTGKHTNDINRKNDKSNPLHRILYALSDLGAGLGDVVLSCCCFNEGLEAIETRMGWSARSGKIVLRIALQQLHRHYNDRGKEGAMIT